MGLLVVDAQQPPSSGDAAMTPVIAPFQSWADACNMGILHAFVSAPFGHTRMGDRPGIVRVTCPVYLISASSQRALLRTGAVGQKPVKPVTEKPATSRLFNSSPSTPHPSAHPCARHSAINGLSASTHEANNWLRSNTGSSS
jgi:hypothetical protein